MVSIFGWDYGSNFPRGGIFQLILGDGRTDYECLEEKANWHKKGKRGHKQNLAARHKKEKERKKKKDKNKKKKRQNKKRKRRKRKDKNNI